MPTATTASLARADALLASSPERQAAPTSGTPSAVSLRRAQGHAGE